MTPTCDVIVIGAGFAGLSAASEAARRGLRVCLFEELMFGGLVVNVNHLDPGAAGLPASGSDLAAQLMTQAADLGVTTVFGAVTALDTGDGLSVRTDDASYSARAVIVATGARLRKLGIPGEAEFEHRGVSSCADCDGPLYRQQDVMVVGGGDSALQEALVLAEYCRLVHLVHRGKAFSARDDFSARLPGRDNIRVHTETVAEALLGEGALSRVKVRGPDGAAREIPCAGFFAYVGLEPNSTFLAAQLASDTEGRVVVSPLLESSVANVFAIGAVRAGYGGRLVDACSDAQGAVAAVAERLRGF